MKLDWNGAPSWTRRRVLALAATAASLAWTGTQTSVYAAGATDKVVRLALGPKLSYSTKFWAAIEAEKNKFEEFGVKVEAIEYPNVQAAIAGTLAGSADVFYADFLLGLNAIKNGQKVTFISPGNQQSELTYFLKRPDDESIKSPADLKGKKIAVGTSIFTHIYTIEWLKSVGLTAAFNDKADVELIESQQTTHPAALKSGDIDVVHTWDRLSAYQWQQDFKFQFVPGTEGGVPLSDFLQASGSVLSGWFARSEFVDENPELIEVFDHAGRQVSHWFTHGITPEEQRAILAKYVKTDFTSLINSLDKKTLDELIVLRETPYPLEGFDVDASSAWVDLVASVKSGYPTSKDVPLREHSAAHLFKQ